VIYTTPRSASTTGASLGSLGRGNGKVAYVNVPFAAFLRPRHRQAPLHLAQLRFGRTSAPTLTVRSNLVLTRFSFEEDYVPADQWFAGAPKEIEKKYFTPPMKMVCSSVM
jgi:hypothetical protein